MKNLLPSSPQKAKAYLIAIGGLIAIVIAAVYLTKTFGSIGKVLRGFTDGLGLTDSEETKAFNAAVSKAKEDAAKVGSPWNVNFYKQAPEGARLLTVSSADNLAKQLWDAHGFFDDNEAAAVGAIKELKAKSQLSFLCERFMMKYKQDLFTWLTKWLTPYIGTPDEELKIITDYVNSLPNY